ncbi:hypothetical protein [Kozakia baliensis]|uniref:hypothetical protein n=1 Tax=Kozakia baliensis TaxID=153496 RepID=UPI0004963E2C|nr:hypothetical protein [Kozakia baliensis]
MSQPAQASNQNRIVHLKAGAHLMTLDAGLFCVFLAPGQETPGPAGLPGVRISHAPNMPRDIVSIKSFDDEGWLSTSNGAALIRVARGPAQILVTIYQAPNSTAEAPRLQVAQLAGPTAQASGGVVANPAIAVPSAPAPRTQAQAPGNAYVGNAAATADGNKAKPEIAAHIQRRGDVLARIGEWMGVPGSQNWIEGFGVAPEKLVPAEDVEYQAVLGKGWLSPWSEGGQYCGSRGMALPILGLRVRLKNASAEKFAVRITATFTDGTRVGPINADVPVETESLAPLEAFLLEILPKNAEAVESSSPKATRKPAAPKVEKVQAKKLEAVAPKKATRTPKAKPAEAKTAEAKKPEPKAAAKSGTRRRS